MGFCAIAWSDAGVARFQLPTKSAEAAERLMRRRAPGAEPGAPPEEVAAVVEAAKRYFAGEERTSRRVRVDLAGQDAFFAQIYAALRRVGWGRTTTYGALAKEVGAGRESGARRRRGDGQKSRALDHSLPPGAGGRAARSAASPRPAGRKRRPACSNWRAFGSGRQKRRSRLSVSDRSPSVCGEAGLAPGIGTEILGSKGAVLRVGAAGGGIRVRKDPAFGRPLCSTPGLKPHSRRARPSADRRFQTRDPSPAAWTHNYGPCGPPECGASDGRRGSR